MINKQKIMYTTLIDTQLGQMMAIADDRFLYLLEFVDGKGLDREIKKLQITTTSKFVQGRTSVTDLIENELEQYFAGTLKIFTTPIYLFGSQFQQSVWQELQKIPHGTTKSYGQVAVALQKPTAFRAVAQANGANQLAIIIPCHRVINADGKLGGYAGGINKKIWLLNHEKNRENL